MIMLPLPLLSKYPFQCDSCLIELIAGSYRHLQDGRLTKNEAVV